MNDLSNNAPNDSRNEAPEAEGSSDRLSLRKILSYSSGQLGLNITYTSIGSYLTYFYADIIQISATDVGWAILIGTAWDAITDPLMGQFSDRVRWKRGRRRPFFGVGAVPMSLIFLFLFSPGWLPVEGHLPIYVTIVIVLLFTFRTVVETPYLALAPELSLDYDERTRISGYRQLFATFGDIIGAMGPLIATLIIIPRVDAYSAFGIVAAFLTVAGFTTAYFGTEEKGQYAKKSTLSLMSAFRATLTNKPFLVVVATMMMTIIANNATVSLGIFVAKYWFLDEGLMMYFMIAFFTGAFASIPCWLKFAKIVGKKTAYIVDIILYGVLLWGILLLKQDAHIAACIVMVMAGFLNLGLWILSGSIVADVVEWDQLRTGERREGAFAGIQAFIIKAAQGVALWAVNLALDNIGYVPDAVQSPDTLLKLRFLYGPIPAVIFWIGAAIFLFYPITKDTHKAMLDEIRAKSGELPQT